MEAVITIRQMRQEEAPLIQKIGRRAFHGMEALIVPKPREALVAERDGAAVGAVLYKCFKSGGQKVGYIDYAFIDPEYHGQGVGGVLYAPGVFHPDVTDAALFQRLAPSADDVWLYWMHRLRGSNPEKVGGRFRVVEWPGSQAQNLRATNLGTGGNDRAIAALMAEYGCPGT